MSSEFLEGELCGVRACLSVLEHEPGISNEDLLGRLRNMIYQLSLGLDEVVANSYLKGDKRK